MGISKNIEEEAFCPYVCRIEHGRPIADNVYCSDGAGDKCKTCGWSPEEASRRSEEIKSGKNVEKVTVEIDATELTGRSRSKGTHIIQFVRDCKSLILSKMVR